MITAGNAEILRAGFGRNRTANYETRQKRETNVESGTQCGDEDCIHRFSQIFADYYGRMHNLRKSE
jgi:hypothetical protein